MDDNVSREDLPLYNCKQPSHVNLPCVQKEVLVNESSFCERKTGHLKCSVAGILGVTYEMMLCVADM